MTDRTLVCDECGPAGIYVVPITSRSGTTIAQAAHCEGCGAQLDYVPTFDLLTQVGVPSVLTHPSVWPPDLPPVVERSRESWLAAWWRAVWRR